MRVTITKILVFSILVLLVSGCQHARQMPGQSPGQPAATVAGKQATAITLQRSQRNFSDLATSGLGIVGLRGPEPAFADSTKPTPDELRQRAIYQNYRALIDISEAGGFGSEFGPRQPVSGTETLAWRQLTGMQYPHAVALLIPDNLSTERDNRACLVVAAASGSRGVYGAAGVAGDWALQRGCAVVYTDKGAGTGFYDFDSGQGVGLDGQLEQHPVGFEPELEQQRKVGNRLHQVAVKHAHSGDNPEAHWGDFVLDAVAFATHEVNIMHPQSQSLTVFAVGISNGGAAVLRAAEQDATGMIDAVIAAEPNIYPPASTAEVVTSDWRYQAADALPAFAYMTQLGVYQPCAVLHNVSGQDPFGATLPFRQQQINDDCDALAAAGLTMGEVPAQQASHAASQLQDLRLTSAARKLGLVNTALGLWPAISATYAQAYARQGADEPVCGVSFAVLDEQGKAVGSTLTQRANWFAASSGIPPAAGVVLVSADGQAPATAEQQLQHAICWRSLWSDNDPATVHESIAATRATANIDTIPVVILHGRSDALIAVNHSSRPYVAAAYQQGTNVRYYEVENAQHFDALLAVPGMRNQLVALHPYLITALDSLWRNVYQGEALAPSQLVRTEPGADHQPARFQSQPEAAAIVFDDATLSIPD